jgi:hypothetical protein
MRAALDERCLAAHRGGRARVVLGRSADFVGPGVLDSTLGGVVFPGALTGGEVLGIGEPVSTATMPTSIVRRTPMR